MKINFVAQKELLRFLPLIRNTNFSITNELFVELGSHLNNFSTIAWIISPYLDLRSKFTDLMVYIDIVPRKDAINICLAKYFHQILIIRGFSFLLIQADYWLKYPFYPSVVQNCTHVSRKTYYIDHYSQPNLIPRTNLKSLRNIVYFGLSENSITFDVNKISRLGFKFFSKQPKDWHDYSDAHIVVNLRPSRRISKPPTKLINSLLAGCLFISLPDDSISHIGLTSDDYVEISRIDDLMPTLNNIKLSPDHYNKIAKNGSLKIHKYFSDNPYSLQWYSVISRINQSESSLTCHSIYYLFIRICQFISAKLNKPIALAFILFSKLS